MPEITFRNKKYNTPIELSLDIIGGKWKLPILWKLQEKECRYGELYKSLGKITHKMLTTQLKELERDGLITRKAYNVIPPKVEYSITPRGMTVIPIITQLREWGFAFRMWEESGENA